MFSIIQIIGQTARASGENPYVFKKGFAAIIPLKIK